MSPGEAPFPRVPKKDRWAPAAKLRTLVPPPWCEALVQPCLQLMTPPASAPGLEECLLTMPGGAPMSEPPQGQQQPTQPKQQQQSQVAQPVPASGKLVKVWEKRRWRGRGGGGGGGGGGRASLRMQTCIPPSPCNPVLLHCRCT
jgi:hypothetical protein